MQGKVIATVAAFMAVSVTYVMAQERQDVKIPVSPSPSLRSRLLVGPPFSPTNIAQQQQKQKEKKDGERPMTLAEFIRLVTKTKLKTTRLDYYLDNSTIDARDLGVQAQGPQLITNLRAYFDAFFNKALGKMTVDEASLAEHVEQWERTALVAFTDMASNTEWTKKRDYCCICTCCIVLIAASGVLAWLSYEKVIP